MKAIYNCLRVARCFERTFSTAQTQPSLVNLVTKLRSDTGLSLAMCRKAAVEAELNYAKALELLKERASEGLNSVREPGKQGLLGVYGDHKALKFVKLSCESDFVAMNSEIVDLVCNAARDVNFPLEESVNLCRAKFRENINVSVSDFQVESGQVLGHYIHPQISSVAGKAVGIVTLQHQNQATVPTAKELARLLAKQLVACRDDRISLDDFLRTEYLFGSVGTVKQLVEKVSEESKTGFSVSSVFSSRI